MRVRQIHITNGLLAMIAIILAAIALMLYQQRPVTFGHLIEAAESSDENRTVSLIRRIPLTRIQNEPLDVEVQNSSIEVEVTNTPISVEIER